MLSWMMETLVDLKEPCGTSVPDLSSGETSDYCTVWICVSWCWQAGWFDPLKMSNRQSSCSVSQEEKPSAILAVKDMDLDLSQISILLSLGMKSKPKIRRTGLHDSLVGFVLATRGQHELYLKTFLENQQQNLKYLNCGPILNPTHPKNNLQHPPLQSSALLETGTFLSFNCLTSARFHVSQSHPVGGIVFGPRALCLTPLILCHVSRHYIVGPIFTLFWSLTTVKYLNCVQEVGLVCLVLSSHILHVIGWTEEQLNRCT